MTVMLGCAGSHIVPMFFGNDSDVLDGGRKSNVCQGMTEWRGHENGKAPGLEVVLLNVERRFSF
jgi:hypothetical protein